MSYDLRLLRLEPGADLELAIHADCPEQGEPDPRPLLAWEPELRSRIVAELQRLNPRFEMFSGGDHVELSDPGFGTQISLYEREAAITVPYWHRGPDAAAAFREIGSYLRAVAGPSGAIVYDPQEGRVLDLDRDLGDAPGTYGFGVSALHRATGTGPRARRPWWRFW